MNYHLSVRRARPGAWLALVRNRWGVTVWQALYDTQPVALLTGMWVRAALATPPTQAAA